jgi:hypothetical protein
MSVSGAVAVVLLAGGMAHGQAIDAGSLLAIASRMATHAATFADAGQAKRRLPKATLRQSERDGKEISSFDKGIRRWIEGLPSAARLGWYDCMHGAPVPGNFSITIGFLTGAEKPADAYPGLAKEAKADTDWARRAAECQSAPQRALAQEHDREARREEQKKREAAAKERETREEKQRRATAAQIGAGNEHENEMRGVGGERGAGTGNRSSTTSGDASDRLAELRARQAAQQAEFSRKQADLARRSQQIQGEASARQEEARKQKILRDLNRDLAGIENQRQILDNGIQQIGDIIIDHLNKSAAEDQQRLEREQVEEEEREARNEAREAEAALEAERRSQQQALEAERRRLLAEARRMEEEQERERRRLEAEERRLQRANHLADQMASAHEGPNDLAPPSPPQSTALLASGPLQLKAPPATKPTRSMVRLKAPANSSAKTSSLKGDPAKADSSPLPLKN